jgi:hypothetical protein
MCVYTFHHKEGVKMLTNSKSLHLMIFVLILVLAIILACSTFASPTATPAPTATFTSTFTPTLTQTFTPSPTNTPTATPTATPNYKATQVAEHEQAARDVLTKLNLPADSGKLGWYQTDPVAIKLEGLAAHFNKISGLSDTSDFVLSTEITWDTDSWPVCGIMFRVDNRWDTGDYYVAQFLRLSGLPAWDIEYYKNGNMAGIPTEKTRFSSYLKLQSGANNEIVMVAVGNEFKMFINSNFEGRYYDYDTKLTNGNFAYLGWQSSGNTTCTFNNTWIWVYK